MILRNYSEQLFIEHLRKTPSANKFLQQIRKQFLYFIVIARCRLQYGKYFPSFSYFGTYFKSLKASEIIAKYEK